MCDYVGGFVGGLVVVQVRIADAVGQLGTGGVRKLSDAARVQRAGDGEPDLALSRQIDPVGQDIGQNALGGIVSAAIAAVGIAAGATKGPALPRDRARHETGRFGLRRIEQRQFVEYIDIVGGDEPGVCDVDDIAVRLAGNRGADVIGLFDTDVAAQLDRCRDRTAVRTAACGVFLHLGFRTVVEPDSGGILQFPGSRALNAHERPQRGGAACCQRNRQVFDIAAAFDRRGRTACQTIGIGFLRPVIADHRVVVGTHAPARLVFVGALFEIAQQLAREGIVEQQPDFFDGTGVVRIGAQIAGSEIRDFHRIDERAAGIDRLCAGGLGHADIAAAFGLQRN